jgi:hypothetical protein
LPEVAEENDAPAARAAEQETTRSNKAAEVAAKRAESAAIAAALFAAKTAAATAHNKAVPLPVDTRLAQVSRPAAPTIQTQTLARPPLSSMDAPLPTPVTSQAQGQQWPNGQDVKPDINQLMQGVGVSRVWHVGIRGGQADIQAPNHVQSHPTGPLYPPNQPQLYRQQFSQYQQQVPYAQPQALHPPNPYQSHPHHPQQQQPFTSQQPVMVHEAIGTKWGERKLGAEFGWLELGLVLYVNFCM